MVFYMTEGRTILRLQAKSPNEPEWRHQCSCPYYSHPIFYSFIQPRSPRVALILVPFKEGKQINTFSTCQG